ncbi:MAG: outer membrane beta-barrel protein [Bacteroidetes bacterium]|nr:outer membrane beta-barrel protein [Bacteroidota bacterium]
MKVLYSAFLLIFTLLNPVTGFTQPISTGSTPGTQTVRTVKPLQISDLGHGGAFKLFITSYGFGIGGFYRYQIDDTWSTQAEIEISPGKEDREFEQYEYYGDPLNPDVVSYTPNKVNSLLLLPLTASVTCRLFKDDIVDNFRPYVTAGGGPLFGYLYPYKGDSFSGLGDGGWQTGVTAFLGFGIDFGMNFTTIQGVTLKYSFQNLPGGVVLMRKPVERISQSTQAKYYEYLPQKKYNFHGLQLSLNIGKMWLRN